MSAVRRTTSTRLTRLAAKASPYHNAVTLYQASSPEEARPNDSSLVRSDSGPSLSVPVRRSRRVKTEPVDTESTHRPESELNTQDTHARKGSSKRDATEPQGDSKAAVSASGNSLSPKKSRSKATPRRSQLSVPHATPARWADVYNAIKDMRSRVVAPVDTMGCDQAQYKEQDPKNQRFATLVSLMLSSQTKDEVTDAAVEKLRAAVGGSLSVQAVLQADESSISEAIAKVGFWRRKTQYIKQTAQRLHEDFDDDIPKTVDELCSLPGVGPKMAYLALQVAWKLNVGIGVDVHVHRITNRLGWHDRPTRNPEETRVNLESWLPKELHGEINHLLVGFGQTICLPVGPKCGECTLSTGDICPSARTPGSKSTSKASKTATASKAKATVRKRLSSQEAEAEASASGPRIEIEIEASVEMGGGALVNVKDA